MMRSVTLLALLFCSACDQSAPTLFEHQGELEVRTRGLVLHDDGDSGHAGMFETTCSFNAGNGDVTGDVDYGPDAEDVLDAGDVGGEPVVLIQEPDAVHILTPGGEGWWDGGGEEDPGVVVPGVVDARLLDEGLVVVRENEGACIVEWTETDSDSQIEIPDDPCAVRDLAVDKVTGTAFVVTLDSGVVAVTAEGSQSLDVDGDLVAWDEAAQVLYVAIKGGNAVWALESAGFERWRVEVDGSIMALDDMGSRGAVSVMVERADRSGVVMGFDGFTGEEIFAFDTPTSSKDLIVSGNGDTIACVLASETHFFKRSSQP